MTDDTSNRGAHDQGRGEEARQVDLEKRETAMPQSFQSRSADMSIGERAASVVGGLMLAAASAKPRPNKLLNVAALAVGSYLAYRGAKGDCPVKRALLGTRQS